MYEDRIQKAVELFKKGYNCSQAVVAAYADLYGYSEEQALRMAASQHAECFYCWGWIAEK